MANPESTNYCREVGNIDQYGDYTVNNWFSSTNMASDRDPRRSLFIMSLGLAGETGEVMEKIKKYVRDGTLDKEALMKELGDVAFYWARICREFGFKPSDVLEMNITKLDDRRKRGVQQGSGDNR